MKIGSRQQAVGNGKKAKIFGFALCAMLYALCESAEPQESKKVPRVGFLEGASIAESQGIEPFRQGLRELGYVEGQNIIVEIRTMEGKPERIPDLIGEFLSAKPILSSRRLAQRPVPPKR